MVWLYSFIVVNLFGKRAFCHVLEWIQRNLHFLLPHFLWSYTGTLGISLKFIGCNCNCKQRQFNIKKSLIKQKLFLFDDYWIWNNVYIDTRYIYYILTPEERKGKKSICLCSADCLYEISLDFQCNNLERVTRFWSKKIFYRKDFKIFLSKNVCNPTRYFSRFFREESKAFIVKKW